MFEQHRRHLRPEPVVDLPNLRLANNVRVTRVRTGSIYVDELPCVIDRIAALVVPGKDHSIQTFGVCFVTFESIEWQSANIDPGLAAICAANRKTAIEAPRALAIVAETIFVVFARDITRQRIPAVSPPKRRAVIR